MNHLPKISHPVLRSFWNSNSKIVSTDMMLPLFISEDDDAFEEITSMPSVYRIGVNMLYDYLTPLCEIGLSSVLLFGVLNSSECKDSNGKAADDDNGPVIKGIKLIKEHFPELLISCDVCLCEYTSHGHCGILNLDGSLCKKLSIDRIASVALAYAEAGAHVVAPSDMMDNRIAEVKNRLAHHGYFHTTIMSYSSKFSSNLYGPFRDACKSGPSFGDRKSYQLPCGSTELGNFTTDRDISEGADIVMVKPGIFYLDVVKSIKTRHPDHLLAVYQVSGEYVMLHDYGTKSGKFQDIVCESLFSCKRAGADIIISYFTPLVLKWLHENGGVLSP